MEPELKINHVNSSTLPPAIKKKRTRTKYYDLFPEPHDPVRGETAVWVAVITQAMMDALSKSRSPEALYLKHEATRWLMDNSPNFILVCQLAGFEPITCVKWPNAPSLRRNYGAPKPAKASATRSAKPIENNALRKAFGPLPIT